MRNFRRDMKAISPVLAVLMMIAVAVAGSLVTYAWVMGYIGFTQTKAGKAIQIQSIANSNDTVPALLVYVQNVGEGTILLEQAGCTYVDGVLMPDALPSNTTILPGKTVAITVPGKGAAPGQRVKVRVVSQSGTFMEATGYPGEQVGGPGGGVTPPPTLTRVQATDTGFGGTATAGNLLVVIANTRTGTAWTTGTLTAIISGWDTREIASYRDDDSDRRAVAIFTKIATGSETTVSVTWGGTNTNTYATIYQEFNGPTTYTPVDSGVNDNGGNPGAMTTNLLVPSTPLSAGSTANILTIGAMVWRDNPGAVSFSNLDDPVSADFNNCYSISEFSYGDAVTQTAVTWGTPRLASGLLIQFSCS